MGIIKTGKIQSHGDVVGLQTRIAALEDKYVKALWYAEISSGASGTITPPTGGTIVLNEWGNDVDAVISTIVTGKKPDFISAKTSVGAIVTATLAANGAWTISGTPSAYPIALVYVYETKLVNFDRASSLYDEEFGQAVNPTDSPTFVGLTLSGLTASLPVVIDAAKALVSLAYTGATSFRKNLGLETEDGPTFDHLHLTTDLPVSEGGTGVSTFALNGILFGNAASAIGVTAIGAEGQFLRVGANPFVPAWSTLTLPNAGTAYRLPVFSATNVMTELAAVGATGEYLKGNNGAIPSWATLNQAAVAGLTTSDSPTFNQGNFTTLHTTTILADHIGEHVGAHTVVFDNTITLPASTIVPDAGTIGLGSGKGLIQFDDETTDFISFMNCHVGIGTSPTAKLDILDSTITPLYVRNATVATYSLIRFYNGGTTALGSMGYDSTGAQFLNDIQSAINMTILNGGNVGIGTTTPGALLHVAGNIRLSGNLLDTNGNIIFAPEERAGAVNYLTVRSGETGVGTGIFAIGADTNISLNLRGKGTGGVWIDDTFANSFEFHGSAASGATMKTTAGDLILKSASVEGLRIQSTTGNVGIGTTNPTNRLQIIQANDASGGGIRLQESGGSGYGAVFYRGAGSTGAFIINNNGLDTVAITSGNVGIGTTTPTQKLDVNGSANITGNITAGGIKLGDNVKIYAGDSDDTRNYFNGTCWRTEVGTTIFAVCP